MPLNRNFNALWNLLNEGQTSSGAGQSTGGLPLYVAGYDSVSSGISLYVNAATPISSGIDLFVKNLYAPASGSLNLFAKADDWTGDFWRLNTLYSGYLHGTLASGSLNLYVLGAGNVPTSGNLNLFVQSDNYLGSVHNSLTLYTVAPSGSENSLNLFVMNDTDGQEGFFPTNDSLNLYIERWPTASLPIIRGGPWNFYEWTSPAANSWAFFK
jgi:hypothetical protein